MRKIIKEGVTYRSVQLCQASERHEGSYSNTQRCQDLQSKSVAERMGAYAVGFLQENCVYGNYGQFHSSQRIQGEGENPAERGGY